MQVTQLPGNLILQTGRNTATGQPQDRPGNQCITYAVVCVARVKPKPAPVKSFKEAHRSRQQPITHDSQIAWSSATFTLGGLRASCHGLKTVQAAKGLNSQSSPCVRFGYLGRESVDKRTGMKYCRLENMHDAVSEYAYMKLASALCFSNGSASTHAN